MGSKKDLTGQKFNRLTALYDSGKRQNNSVVWHCLCDCGNECDVVSTSLVKGRTKSCGCLKKESDRQPKGNVIDMVGQQFNKLTVISREGSDDRGEAKWLCKCECGNEVIVLGSNLRKGHTTSCGCERRSRGELKVAKLLRELKVPFEQEYKAFKFSSGSWAKFDFYVNNNYLIEYDGETHYNYNLHGWHNEEQLRQQQERDIIKTQWCKDNNIPLVRIPYTRLDSMTVDDVDITKTEFIVK